MSYYRQARQYSIEMTIPPQKLSDKGQASILWSDSEICSTENVSSGGLLVWRPKLRR